MTQKNIDRPLSPHLQIYKWQLTMIMSIAHRFSGAGLAIGIMLFIWLLLAAATSEAAYNTVLDFCMAPIGKLFLLGWTGAFFYHLFNGIRHLFWDMGYLFKIKNAYMAGYVVLISTVVCTVLTALHIF